MNPFHFQAPPWANTASATQDSERLDRAHSASQAYYALATQTGIHSMIEWCGVMTEYAFMLRHVHMAHGVSPDAVNQHSDVHAAVPEHMADYLCEKLGCQLKPFIRANPELWRELIDKWFAP